MSESTINEQSFTYLQFNAKVPLGYHYYAAAQRILSQFPGHYRHELAMLHVLYHHNAPISYGVLNDLTNKEIPLGGWGDMAKCLDHLTANEYILRNKDGRKIGYTITDKGRKLLFEFSWKLDLMVKERILKFAKD